MIDPKTAWLLTKTALSVLSLLVKSTALIGMIYFATFTNYFFLPFFTIKNNTTLLHEAKLVYICCFIVIGFLALLIGEQLVSVVCSLFPGNFLRGWKPEALPYRILCILAVGLLLSAGLFGTLYPLFKALAWREVFSAAGRADLEEQATALVVFMGIALTVGILSLLRLSRGLIVQCWGASGYFCGRKKQGGGEEIGGIPL
ncbi:hypothetical protein N0V93_006124 [Gnomoniopsis smithogilvyi]|uniref:Uncharacterized protein n=1 Tax=Gnomoniopsis smithogilvyi TaxID=1191159 RepID=A0A9W8YRA9_9PEZI|nr:hypothetical protein N0V93_006124 [Gnomoniopsis smithogilvyi]